MLPSRKSWSCTILFFWDFAKSWSQRQKVGIKYSKFGVNENSEITSSYQYLELTKSWRHSYWSCCKYLKFNSVMHRKCLVAMASMIWPMYVCKAKKKGIRFSGHFLQKQMRQAGFFFVFFIPPQNKLGNFFFFIRSNLTLILNANKSGKYVSYAFFLGWDSLGMQLELASALCLGLEQGSCSKLYVTPKSWDTIILYAVKIINLSL